MGRPFYFVPALLLGLILAGCFGAEDSGSDSIVVNSLEDLADPPRGVITLRSAIEEAESGERITFHSSLNGQTIRLDIVGESSSTLKGEVFTMGPGGWTFEGFQERDYGRSALYTDKDVYLDASDLPDGITVAWDGGVANPARVMAVYGNLTMKNITVTGGYSVGEAIPAGRQPYTLARGGGLAVWGVVDLEDCVISGNRIEGDESPSRDRGAFGGGIYANCVILNNCIVSGNSVIGYGAAGGGVYSVGGADGLGRSSSLTGCSVTGNNVAGQHTYGGGVYTDGGGPGNLMTLTLTNCTIARNLVRDNPNLDENPMAQYYYRGGGVYMSNGHLVVSGCTIVENEVTGNPMEFPTTDRGKPNMGGGGIAATIGDAHVVEDIKVSYSIIAGNTVLDAPDDLFTGSLLHFYSYGYNLIGRLNFDYILAPVPDWYDLNRRHWPKAGDQTGVDVADVLSLAGAEYHESITSVGADEGSNVVLWYPPAGDALDRIPAGDYEVQFFFGEYEVAVGETDDFLVYVLDYLRTGLGLDLGVDFDTAYPDVTGLTWYGPAETWPSNPDNYDWIDFWRDLDEALGDELGTVKMGDDVWGDFLAGEFGDNLTIRTYTRTEGPISPLDSDQLGNPRPYGSKGDIGAIEDGY